MGIGIATQGFGATKPPPFELIEIADTALMSEIWKTIELEGIPAPGHYQILIRHVDQNRNAFLLREGTQVAVLPEFALSLLESKGAKMQPKEEETQAMGPAETTVWTRIPTFKDSLLGLMQWPSGVRIEWQTSAAALQGSSLELSRRWNFLWMQKPLPWLTFELGLTKLQNGGGLSKILDTSDHSYWGENWWGWQISLGIPGLKWQIFQAHQPIPEFVWLDPDAADAAKLGQNGNLVRQWSKGRRLPGNLTQAVHAKLGILRYSIYLDQDAYTVPIQQFLLDDLPSPFGPWGAGFMLGGSAIYSLLRIDFLPITFDLFPTKVYHHQERFGFLRLDLGYRTKKNFHIGLTTHFTLNHALLSWPDAKIGNL